MGEINFDFADKSSPMSYTLKLASKMQSFEDEKIPDLIRHMYVVEEFDQ